MACTGTDEVIGLGFTPPPGKTIDTSDKEMNALRVRIKHEIEDAMHGEAFKTQARDEFNLSLRNQLLQKSEVKSGMITDVAADSKGVVVTFSDGGKLALYDRNVEKMSVNALNLKDVPNPATPNCR